MISEFNDPELNGKYLGTITSDFVKISDLLEDFKMAYKDPDEFCCLFVMDGAFTRFVYIPYPND